MAIQEVIFRGKRKDNGEWVEGYYSNLGGNRPCILKEHILNGKMARILEYENIIVLPSTVGQYTGLTDKNGRRIFEGDIVTGYFNHEKIVGYIFYGGNAQFFIQRDGIYGIGLDNSDCWLEVIGNIHDNPELFETAAKPADKNIAQSELAPATENFELMEG